MPLNIERRPITADDEEFLFRLYAETRENELSQMNWDKERKLAFLHAQFSTQHDHYRTQYSKADFELLICDGQPAGRFYVDRSGTTIRLIDMTIRPGFRRQGIGSQLLRDLLEEGARTGRAVQLHVEKFNPAIALCERFGFIMVDDNHVHYLMESTDLATNGTVRPQPFHV